MVFRPCLTFENLREWGKKHQGWWKHVVLPCFTIKHSGFERWTIEHGVVFWADTTGWQFVHGKDDEPSIFMLPYRRKWKTQMGCEVKNSCSRGASIAEYCTAKSPYALDVFRLKPQLWLTGFLVNKVSLKYNVWPNHCPPVGDIKVINV